MPLPIPENELKTILDIVERHPEGIGAGAIDALLKPSMPRRTLSRRLAALMAQGRLQRHGSGAAALYRVATSVSPTERAGRAEVKFKTPEGEELVLPLSREAQEIREYVGRAQANRRPVSYNSEWLETYQPNSTEYLPASLKDHLFRIGKPIGHHRPEGTFARDIFNRLLIDLSWASSRLEGNTYSRLDTQHLIEFGRAAEGKDAAETQMILNHKAAIELLVAGGEEIAVDRYTLLNLHAVLAENLLPDSDAWGKVRTYEVLIHGSVYYPPADPYRLNQLFDALLAKAAAIENPFEQAFFLMVHIPYLQPFADVNKRVSRLAANIPFIKKNLGPLSFVDVPREAYIEATLGVYELTRIEWLRDLFVWAYERSCQRYVAVRDSIGGPDVFRLRYREALTEVVNAVVCGLKKPVPETVRELAQPHVEMHDLDRFVDMAIRDLQKLHTGNIARYRLKRADYERWQRELKYVPPAPEPRRSGHS